MALKIAEQQAKERTKEHLIHAVDQRQAHKTAKHASQCRASPPEPQISTCLQEPPAQGVQLHPAEEGATETHDPERAAGGREWRPHATQRDPQNRGEAVERSKVDQE